MDAIETDSTATRTVLPSERVRALAEIVRHAWEPFTDDERLDFLAIVNAARAPLDKHTVEKMIAACGTIGLAAKSLGVARRTLQKRMRDFGLDEGKRGRRAK